MEWMSLNTVREKYLSFFESKGHLRLPSFSLVPNNDKSLLLINSGMAPMKKYFTGEVKPPRNRVTTCQKCIRTPDLERVGHTARHGTFFEMLGNFSFGDYFKNEAIPWAWEFLTETMEIDPERLWPSVYESDDEAYDIWKNVIGVPEERIVRLGKEDNFWEHGTGPCGPCSEIYFDRGEKYGCGSPDCKPGCECDRYMEIWNNVFSQFNNMGDGTYTDLATKNIDTGMGLERLACVLQEVDNMFEVDTVRSILNKVCEISKVEYGKDNTKDISIRAITDHARSSVFMICDGIIPSNEGRGYVLRRLIRRASRHGRLLGVKDAFLASVCEVAIAQSADAYPELREKSELILQVVAHEEAAFAKTIDQGLGLLSGLIKEGGVLSGDDAFKLYDTYGFPVDLTRDIIAESGMILDEETFKKRMEEQRNLARASRKSATAESWKSDGISFENIKATDFVGYEEDSCEAAVVALAINGETTNNVSKGDKAIVVLDKTAFYAESGGQVGDTGVISGETFEFNVENTIKDASGLFLHIGEVVSGEISVGDKAKADIDIARRNAIRRNHTAAHLLQAALRTVLGTHVEQAGQLVNDAAVRFDFTHFSALTPDELVAVEAFINNAILEAANVENEEMPIEKAKELGAMALFGEKYGDVVRVVNVPGKSIELCGGTHVSNTGAIGLFKIISESSAAAGIRRIEAVTGSNVLALIDSYKTVINNTAAVLKAPSANDLVKKAEQLVNELSAANKKLEQMEAKAAAGKTDELMKSATNVGPVKVIAAVIENAAPDKLRTLCDNVKSTEPSAVCLFAGVNGEKVTFCAACGKEALKAGANAGTLVREIAKITGGNGGGKPDSAMAGGKDASKVKDAVAAAYDIVKLQVGE